MMLYLLQIGWEQISFILGIFGNVFVLYATTSHNAIKLDNLSIWIIKNLAVADIGNCVLVILPFLLTQYGKLNHTLIFGETFYTYLGSYLYTFFVANLFLVNILSLNKLERCMDPLRNMASTRYQRIKVTIFTVLVSSILTLWTVYGLVDGFLTISEEWRMKDYLGAARIGKPYRNDAIGSSRKIIIFGLFFIFGALPCITLVIINSALIIFALKKSNSAINKRKLLMVVMVTVIFLISFIPHFLDLILGNYMTDLPLEYSEIAVSVAFLSVWVNPFVYYAVNPSFKEFTKRRLFVLKRRVEHTP